MSLIRADARALPLAAGVVHCCVTSPPYFGLRDYGVTGQIGLEATPDAYVASLVAVFREVWRVLREDGTCWINLGDSYASGGRTTRDPGQSKIHPAFMGAAYREGLRPADGMKPKDLIGSPWRVAFALQADGWYLRSDIIWAKPNPMPESVTDRPTKAHEYVFLLTKQERYFYDAKAIAERALEGCDLGLLRGNSFADGRYVAWHAPSIQKRQAEGVDSRTAGSGFRNKRSVWTVTPEPYLGAHFATMPEALIEPCILAGCPLGGLVLDPFIGSGTVGAVASRLGRRWVGTDLTYQMLAAERTAQRGLLFHEELPCA